MEFHTRQLSYTYLRKNDCLFDKVVTGERYYQSIIDFLHRIQVVQAADEFLMESWWYEDKQPYYLVYPNIIPVLLKLNLEDVKCGQLSPQRRSLALRLPKGPGNPFRFKTVVPASSPMGGSFTPEHEKEWEVHTVLILDMGSARNAQMSSGICLWFDIGEYLDLPITGLIPPHCWSQRLLRESNVNLEVTRKLAQDPKNGLKIEKFILATSSRVMIPFPVYTYRCFDTMDDEASVAEKVKALKVGETADMGVKIPEEIADQLTRLALSVMMIDAGDTTLLEPDLLREHEHKLKDRELTPEESAAYHQKAQQRGKYGWHLGRQFHQELSRFRVSAGTPYYVPPHVQHYHVGPGRQKVVLKAKAGWIANREKVENVPSGYELSTGK